MQGRRSRQDMQDKRGMTLNLSTTRSLRSLENTEGRNAHFFLSVRSVFSRECFQKFFGQFWRQSRSNRRSQVDSYCMNTDQLAKPAVVDFSELSRSKLPQNLLKTLPNERSERVVQSTRQVLGAPKL